jgi:gliding motility-associated-like protein
MAKTFIGRVSLIGKILLMPYNFYLVIQYLCYFTHHHSKKLFYLKRLLLVVLILISAIAGFAKHIKGGWVQYEYQGAGTTANTSIYKITVYVFRDCTQNGPMPSSLGIYDAATYQSVQTISNTSYSNISTPSKTTFDPCLSNPPTICYSIYTYSTTVTLPDNVNGYIIAASDANRVTGIVNVSNSSATGISFTATIPGTINSVDYHKNSNPYFEFKDTVVICYNTNFSYQFKATDVDGDSLSYSFGNGINGTQTLSAPPYNSIPYSGSYSGSSPLGSDVTIDPVTGLISGKAPATTGEYVIAVYVSEWRNGIMINSTRKELQINVANCSLSAAALRLSYINCDNYVFTFQNEATASNINAYLWDFGVTTSTKDTSTQATPTYTYADTGTYVLKLTVANTGGCQDSAKSIVRVYPGFTPAFTVAGSCYQSPFTFTDISFTKYGVINSWSWNFGDPNSTTDTSAQKNATYQYGVSGTNSASLTVTNSKGCSGTVTKIVTVNNKPQITLPFKDTLICSIDSLPLIAQSTGTYSWSPNYNIINPTSNKPIVFPKDTTVYTVTVADQGCIDSATITVNVLDFITVKLPADTGICRTDSITLSPKSDALSYVWTESGGGNTLSSKTVKYPEAAPSADSVIYYVTANLGYCQDKAQITVHTAVYPTATVSADTSICFGSRANLKGSNTGAFYSWSPINTLYQANTLQPIAGPQKTTSYVLTVGDTSYCKKLVTDTVVVTVIPQFNINAGNDTSVVIGQPLQLTASGDTTSLQYIWQPSSYLNNNTVYNPIATFTNSAVPDIVPFTVIASTKEGCTSTDMVNVKVYKMLPDILVPSGFTPNGDGKNDILKPILIGIAKLHYFNVYNRYGQLVFTTSNGSKGWDGAINGTFQSSNTFVFMAEGIDYLGNIISRKGTTVLIK